MANQLPPESGVSFEEYRLYYESAEKVTERRHELNRWNYSIVVAILAAIGLVLNWATNDPSHMLVGTGGIAILCGMAIGLCSFWIRQITDFKELNAAKFGVLNAMAPLVRFSSDGQGVESYRPFEREWDVLQRRKVLVQVGAGRIGRLLVLSASRAEYFIPQALRVVFAAILAVVVVFAVTDHKAIFNRISPFDGVVPSIASPKATP